MTNERTILRILVVSLILIVPFLIWLAPGIVASVFGFIWFLAPIWLPVLLLVVLVPLWILYVRSQYVASIRYTVLELKPGDHTPKSARAMELVFYSLYHRTNISRVMAILVGQVRLPWSFEIVSHAGTVRFFMRIPTAHRQAIESRLRAEYRDIDIDEVRDYAREVAFNASSMKLEMREYTFTKPDPYPLKTYEEYEAMKHPTNPNKKLLEKLVSVGENEYFFISYLVRPHQRERKRIWENPTDTLHKDAAKEIERIVGSGGDIHDLPEAKKKLVKAIEDALKKPSFDCGVRAVYFANREAFDEKKVQLLESLFNDFEDTERNGLVAFNPETRFSWPLSDIARAIPGFASSHMFNLYRRRAFYAPPYYGDPVILNTAELATMFHLPYISRSSPLARGRGTRLEPPENLPVVQ